jgi:hypothetical protein
MVLEKPEWVQFHTNKYNELRAASGLGYSETNVLVVLNDSKPATPFTEIADYIEANM